MTERRKRRILSSLVLGFAVAAFVAPAALGEPRGPGNTDPVIADTIRQSPSPDDRSFYRGTSAQLDSRIVSPDDRSLFRGVAAPNAPGTIVASPDDRSLYRGFETQNVPVSVTVSSLSDDFHWTDAGLGAVTTLAFVLILGAATLLIRHQRRRLVAY
jgi:hypothetical protein